MIVKIFDPVAGFPGISYNTRKIDRQKGELMRTANFGPLQAFGHLKPQNHVNYLAAISKLNGNVKYPQFHAVISATGRTYGKKALTDIAESWLKEMGYGSQPYLIVFHKDTGNNHVHMVSTRVGRDGRKISSAFEYVRAQRSMNKVLGYEAAMQYRFSTRAQLVMILETSGSPGTDPDEELVARKISEHRPDKKRAEEISALLKAYRSSTELVALMKANFRIDLLFHSAEGKRPYGYTIIDHDTKQVFKGSEVLPLRSLLRDGQEMPAGSSVTEGEQEEEFTPDTVIRPVSIADDVDDQQIHGMRRRRQKKARTNIR